MRAAERQSIPEGWAHEHMQGWRVPADASNGSQRRRLDCCISKVRQRLVAATGSRPSLALECEPGGLEVIGLREWRMVDVLYAPLHGAPDAGRKAWKCSTAHRCAGARSKGELQVGSLLVQLFARLALALGLPPNRCPPRFTPRHLPNLGASFNLRVQRVLPRALSSSYLHI